MTLINRTTLVTKQDTEQDLRVYWIDILNKQNQAFKDVGVNNQHPFYAIAAKKFKHVEVNVSLII